MTVPDFFNWPQAMGGPDVRPGFRAFHLRAVEDACRAQTGLAAPPNEFGGATECAVFDVMPAKAGIQSIYTLLLDSRLRGSDRVSWPAATYAAHETFPPGDNPASPDQHPAEHLIYCEKGRQWTELNIENRAVAITPCRRWGFGRVPRSVIAVRRRPKIR
jgi:hypothetical protein